MRDALTTYGFLSAKLKTRLSKTLPPEAIDRLVKARSLPEAVQFLKGTAFAAIEEAYSATGDLRSGEALLNARELELYTGMFRYLDEPVLSFVRALSLRFEVDKVKDAVRLWFDVRVRHRDVDGKSGYLYRETIAHRFDVDEVIRAADADAVVSALGGTPYATIASRELPKAVAARSVFEFEMALDRFFYDEVFSAAGHLGKSDRGIAERILGVDVDLQNISWLVRFKGYFHMNAEQALSHLIPRGKSISASAVAAACAEEKSGPGGGGALGMDLLRKSYGNVGMLLSGGDAASRLAMMEAALRRISAAEATKSLGGYPFSIGIVLAYFTRSREELRTIMTILNAKNYALPEERIRSFL
jgi:V/A-type H+-transporting ATPase subunit C